MATIPQTFGQLVSGNRLGTIPVGFRLSHDFANFVNLNNMTFNLTAIYVWHYLRILTEVFGVALPWEDAAPFGSMIVLAAGAAASVVVSLNSNYPANANDPNITAEIWQLLNNSASSATKQLIDLTGCHQVSRLAERNIRGYYQSCNIELSEAVVMRVLNYAATALPRLVDDAQFQAIIPTSDFLRYHTAATSTIQLVDRMVNAAGGLLHIGPNTANILTHARNNPWDKAAADAIPRVLVGLCYLFLESTGQLPTNPWYQGRRELDNLSLTIRITWKSHFDRFVALTRASVAGAAPPPNITALIASVVNDVPAVVQN